MQNNNHVKTNLSWVKICWFDVEVVLGLILTMILLGMRIITDSLDLEMKDIQKQIKTYSTQQLQTRCMGITMEGVPNNYLTVHYLKEHYLTDTTGKYLTHCTESYLTDSVPWSKTGHKTV